MPDSPLVDRLRIASPCSEDWGAMRGTDRVRFCSHCGLSVHQASRMTRREIEALVRASKGRLCMRIERDERDRVRTLDPLPLVPLTRRTSRLAAGAMTIALAAGAAAPALAEQEPTPAAAASARADAKPSGGAVGRIVGTVRDPVEAPIEAASVEVKDADGKTVASGPSDYDGRYGFDVPEGTYTVTVECSGFKTTVVPDVAVGAAQTAAIPIAMEVGGAETGLIVLPAAYGLVWHSDEREAADARESAPRPPIVDAEDAARAIREARDVDERDVFGDTALMYLADDARLTRLLLKAGADPNAADRYGATPLMRAAVEGNVETTRLLLEAGARVDATDSAGLTALMAAAGCGSEDVVKALVAAGADVNAIDARGETALTYARAEKEKTVIKILRAAGAR